MLTTALRRYGAALGLLIAAILVLSLLPIPTDDPLIDAVLDAGHVPCFGILAVLARRTFARSRFAHGPRWHSELFALLVAGALGFLSELLQIRNERNADPVDLIHDMTGAAAFLVLARVFASFRIGLRLLLSALGLALLTISLWPLGVMFAHRRARDTAMPVICDPGKAWGRALIGLRDSQLWFPAGRDHPNRAALRFGPQAHAALILRRPHPDWRPYHQLVLDLFSTNKDSFELEIRIDDSAHRGAPTDRYYKAVRLGPGELELRIDLEDVKHSPATREMDMGAIRSLALFVEEGVGPLVLYFGPIRLQ